MQPNLYIINYVVHHFLVYHAFRAFLARKWLSAFASFRSSEEVNMDAYTDSSASSGALVVGFALFAADSTSPPPLASPVVLRLVSLLLLFLLQNRL